MVHKTVKNLLVLVMVLGYAGCNAIGVSIEDDDSTDSGDDAARFSVQYDANGAAGGVPVDAESYAEGDEVTVLDQGEMAKDGYGFAGWNTVADGSETGYSAGDTFRMPASDITLYAQWTQGLTVSFVPEEQEEIDVSSDPDAYVSNSVWTRVSLTVNGSYDSYAWYVNGSASAVDGNTFSFWSAEYASGVHTFLVVVTKDGASYSTSVKVRVIQ